MTYVPTQPQIANTTAAFGLTEQLPGAIPGPTAGEVVQSTLAPYGGGGGGSGTVTSVTATDTTIVVSGTTTVAPTIARAAITGDVTIAAMSNAAVVVALRGVSVSATAPTTNQVLEYNGTAWTPTTLASGAVSSVTAGDGTLTITPTTGAVVATRPAITGDVTIATASNAATVVAVNGTSVPATPTSGQVLTATSGTSATWQAPAGGAPTGAAGGNLSGTYPNPTVAAVNGTTVPATPSAGQVLTATSGTAATWQTPPAASVVVATQTGTYPITLTTTTTVLLTLTGLTVGTWIVSASATVSMANATANNVDFYMAPSSGSTATYTIAGPAVANIQEGATGLSSKWSVSFRCVLTVTSIANGTTATINGISSTASTGIVQSTGNIETGLQVTGAVAQRVF